MRRIWLNGMLDFHLVRFQIIPATRLELTRQDLDY